MKKKQLKWEIRKLETYTHTLIARNLDLLTENEKLKEQLKKQPTEIMICNDKHAEFIQQLQRKFQNA